MKYIWVYVGIEIQWMKRLITPMRTFDVQKWSKNCDFVVFVDFRMIAEIRQCFH